MSWNDEETPEREAVASILFDSAWPKIDALEAKVLGDYMVVEPESTLAVDITFLGPWRDGLIRSAINSSFDALKTVQFLLDRNPRVLPMTGLYPLLRSAIENASLALYLLAPTERDERLRRAIREAAGEIALQRKFTAHFDRHGAADIAAEWRTSLTLVLAGRQNLEINPNKVSAEAISTIISFADTVIRRDLPSPFSPGLVPLLALWQLLSGLSHGKQWALLTALARSNAVVEASGHVAHVRLTTKPQTVAVILHKAIETLEVSLQYYGRRARKWSNHPEDSAEVNRPVTLSD